MIFIYENRCFFACRNTITLKYRGQNYIVKLDESLKELSITRESNRVTITCSLFPAGSDETVAISHATGDVVNLDAYLPIAEYASTRDAESIKHEDISEIMSENFDTVI